MVIRFTRRAGLLAGGAVALLLAGPAAEATSLVPNQTVDITFTSLGGGCGMHLVINQSTGLVTGNTTGCAPFTPLVGTVGSNSKLGAMLTVLSNGLLFVIDAAPQNFTIYRSDGTQTGSGSYTLVFARPGVGRRPTRSH